jgi:hypothetical protein
MTARPVPRRHWRSYGDSPLPTGAEALDEPLLLSDIIAKTRAYGSGGAGHQSFRPRGIGGKYSPLAWRVP